ncbi:uncharacterized protein M6G45_010555 isoform 1-T2 [Spheniscus humboldti]
MFCKAKISRKANIMLFPPPPPGLFFPLLQESRKRRERIDTLSHRGLFLRCLLGTLAICFSLGERTFRAPVLKGRRWPVSMPCFLCCYADSKHRICKSKAVAGLLGDRDSGSEAEQAGHPIACPCCSPAKMGSKSRRGLCQTDRSLRQARRRAHWRQV